MNQKLKSRKLWVAIGALLSVLVAEFTGIQLPPEAYGSLTLIVVTYILGQGLVDKSVNTKQVEVGGDAGKLQLQLYVRRLEEQLEVIFDMNAPQDEAATVLEIVPDLEE